MLILSSAFVFAIAKIQFISLICNFLRIILLKKKHFVCLRGSIITHLRKFVSSVPEYRRTSKGNFKYKLEDILMLVIRGRLGKCMTRPDIIRFGERNLKRFRSLGILLVGVPIWSKITPSVSFSCPKRIMVFTKLLPNVEYSHAVRITIVLGH